MNTTQDARADHATTHPAHESAHDPDQVIRVRRALRRAHFGMLATVSDRGFPHAAGVAIDVVDDGPDTLPLLYVHMMRSSRKAANIAADGRVAMTVPVRKLPVGPPFTIQFQGRAELVDMDAPEILALLERAVLPTVSGHGALDEPDGVFVRVVPTGRVHTYGIGVSTIGLIRDPLHVGGRTVERL